MAVGYHEYTGDNINFVTPDKGNFAFLLAKFAVTEKIAYYCGADESVRA